MRIMSFFMTPAQIRDGSKTVTRRFGWAHLKPGDMVMPVRKAMGLKKGEKVQPLRGPIRIVSNRPELLRDITPEDCAKEGFPDLTPEDFVRMLERQYGLRRVGAGRVNRIEFEYTD